MPAPLMYNDMKSALRATPLAIFGIRGGLNQNSSFHQAYLSQRNRSYDHFLDAQGINEKRAVYDSLISWVEDQGGKFYGRTTDGRWTEMSMKQKRQKVAVAFRDLRLMLRNQDFPQTIEQTPQMNHAIDVAIDPINVDPYPAPYLNAMTVNDASVNAFPLEINDDRYAEEWSLPFLEFVAFDSLAE